MVVDIMYECGDICERAFDVEVELGSSRANTMVSMLVFSNENRKGETLL